MSIFVYFENARWLADFDEPMEFGLRKCKRVSIFMSAGLEPMVDALPLKPLAWRQLYYGFTIYIYPEVSKGPVLVPDLP